MKLEELLSFIARKAGAGLCCFGAESKHLFLEEISRACEEHGFNMIGERDPRAEHSDS